MYETDKSNSYINEYEALDIKNRETLLKVNLVIFLFFIKQSFINCKFYTYKIIIIFEFQ